MRTWSAAIAKTIGIVRVSRWRAPVATVVFVTIMSGRRPTQLLGKSQSIGGMQPLSLSAFLPRNPLAGKILWDCYSPAPD